MLYVNQLEYPHLTYNHNTLNGGPPEGRNSVKTSGCGLCCASMVVDQLTDQTLPIEDCVRLSEETGANQWIGTSMKVLGKALSERYEIDFSYTNDIDEAIEHLAKGGRVIVLVGGARDGYADLFTKRGHYMLLLSYDGEEFCILDPALSDEKYAEEGRVGRVRIKPPFLYSSKEEIVLAAEAQKTRYFLFSRRKI